MSSNQTATHIDVLSVQTTRQPSEDAASHTKLHEEDGWIFSERPGIGVTCLRRSGDLPQPYISQHNYPSEC